MPSSDPTEFLLGHLSTDEGRAQRARSRRVGLQHADLLQPIDPQPGEAVWCRSVPGVGEAALQSATLHHTTGRYQPDADSASTQHLPMQPAPAEWDTLTWAHIQTERRHPGSTLCAWVRYHITAITITGEPIACPFIPLQAP
ncbi:MAG: hypothetical protein U0452_09740 [Anaerolineae bacterium]